jgi:hypothetical protein
MYGFSNVITYDYEILFLLVLELRQLSVSLRGRFWLLIISVPGKHLYNSVHTDNNFSSPNKVAQTKAKLGVLGAQPRLNWLQHSVPVTSR